MNKECALLTLQTMKVAGGQGFAETKFKNIPLKKIMGDIYHKYNKFKLVLNSHGCNFQNTTSRGQHWYIKLSGLDWVNTTQYAPTSVYNKEPLISLATVNTSFYGQVRNLPGNNGYIFSKPSNQMIDLTVTYITKDLIVPTFTIGHAYFLFSIYGVEDDVVN